MTIAFVSFIPILFVSIFISLPIVFKNLHIKNFFSFFLYGSLLYLVIHIVPNKKKDYFLSFIYILAHEVSHALAGLIRGNKVKRIKLTPNEGYVSFIKKTDRFTAIFPYIFPFYNIFTCFIFFIKYIFSKHLSYPIFIFLQGFFLTFHIIHTILLLPTPQDDFRRFYSFLISILFIVSVNIFIAVIIVSLVNMDTKTIYMFVKSVFNNVIFIIVNVFKILYQAIALVMKK